MSIRSVFWAIALSLFVGALGFPIPENPILMGGGYAIFNQVSPPAASLGLWFVAIVAGTRFFLPSLTGFLIARRCQLF